MTPERWAQIEDLYQRALGLEKTQQAAFLKEACRGDDGLRREVERLLKQDRQAGSFMEEPALQGAARQLVTNPERSWIGKRIRTYEFVSLLGVGGMGEVYRARDTKLQRDVAIKVLPSSLAREPERLKRFEQEARMLAALNHPHIGSIYGLEEAEGRQALVLELVEGPTLADRLERGPIPVKEALAIAQQITEALEAAHEAGIIHRDLKPANIKITADGNVKVLDFGLAKAMAEDAAAVDLSQMQTATKDGMILGTPAYMSPEQARGQKVDKRTDIWAFGCVLYEMLTGRPAFSGDTAVETIGSVLGREPDWDVLPKSVPPSIQALLGRCIEKDPKRRLRDIGEARIEIENVLAGAASEIPVRGTGPQKQHGNARRAWFAAALLLGVCIALIFIFSFRRIFTGGSENLTSRSQSAARMVITLPAGNLQTSDLRFPVIVLSPDGSHLACVIRPLVGGTRGQLYLRKLDELEFTPIPGTEGASSPFFSPDGKWIGFYAAGKLKKVSVSGGPSLIVSSSPDIAGASWGSDDKILFSASSRLYKVAASGGESKVLFSPDSQKGEADYNWPDLLPGGKAVLFSIQRSASGADDAQIVVQSLETAERRVLVEGGSFPRYVPTGYLTYVRGGTLLAVPFDPVRWQVRGAPVPILEGIMYNNAGGSSLGLGASQFSFSNAGWLVYIPGTASASTEPLARLGWVDRKGLIEPLQLPPKSYLWPRVSPDGRKLAVLIESSANAGSSAKADIWIYDVAREALTRLTSEGDDGWPIWTPDGKRVTFTSNKYGPQNIFWKSVDGGGPEERLTTSDHAQVPRSWSPDGQQLIFADTDPTTSRDLWLLPIQGDRKPRPLLRTSFDENNGVVSPDGHWLAYISNQSGRNEVYVQAFPDASARWQVSSEGGTEAVWARSGKELFYINGNKMMVADVIAEPAFATGKTRMLFENARYVRISGTPNYDVSLDGQRFLMVNAEQEGSISQVIVVSNWFDELTRKAPVKDR